MTVQKMEQIIDFYETNYGYGDHRTWPRSDRLIWHKWAAEQSGEPHPIEECDCNNLP